LAHALLSFGERGNDNEADDMNRLVASLDGLITAITQWRGEIVERDRVIASSLVDRLTLRYVKDGPLGKFSRREYVEQTDNDGNSVRVRVSCQGADFHSLAWERFVNLQWRPHRSITAAKFQSTSDYTRWVADIVELDAATGVAIVKVAEAMQPRHAKIISYGYSWRSWDLTKNQEVAVLQRCANPAQRYGGKSD
jgi:hypothetical protein